MTQTASNRGFGTKQCPGTPNRQEPESADAVSWGDAERTGTAYDFRTDAVTTPSLNQLAAITHATLNDDVFGEDRTTTLFESQMASLCGVETAAFVISGTMANQLAIAALSNHAPPTGILASSSSHVLNFEAGGIAHLTGAMSQPVTPSNGLYLTLADIQSRAKLDPFNTTTLTLCPTRILSLENTSHGNPIPLSELRAIKSWATQNNIQVHVDGARIWHAVAADPERYGTLSEIASCADALTVSFAKGIGAPIGAMVVGSKEVVSRVKRLRQSIGGGVRKVGILAAAAREAMRENWGEGETDERGVLGRVHEMARRVEGMWMEKGGGLARKTETNMVWLDLGRVDAKVLNEMAWRRGLLVAAPRLVMHHQICDRAVELLGDVFDEVLVRVAGEDGAPTSGRGVASKGCVLE
ncbi:pyridoxal phosphate-dependent transferase [Immersiella caudata]|uniref:Pyridoxal phosphate-dependent transferase n=1 Tax=Immersiella caudata TaxID=314043 RepID=A0AA39WNW4_9PEZI|nr:pyridoxal phosphate-dependent transferase [Immersiella caudata]